MITNVNTEAALAAALGIAKSGDVIQLAPGTYRDVAIAGLRFADDVTITSQDSDRPAVFTGLRVKQSSGLTFENLEFRVSGNSVFVVTGSEDVHFSDISMHGSMDGNPKNDGEGLLLRDSSNVSVSGSEFQQLHWGVGHSNVEGLRIAGNDFHDIRMDGVRGGGSSNVEVSGNSFRDFDPKPNDHFDAIQFWTTNTTASAHDILIADNLFIRGSGGAAQGIFMRDEVGGLPFLNVTITGNLISGGTYNGISVNNARNVMVADNIVQGYSDRLSWIALKNVDGAVLEDNMATKVTFLDSTNITQAGTTLLAPAGDLGVAAKAAWDALQGAAGLAIEGTAASDLLFGANGDDTLDGVSGADTLVGGTGDDTYMIGAKATVTEFGDGGVDTVRTSVAFVLPNHVENLVLTGAKAIAARGNALGNQIVGNEGANVLYGWGGSDTLTGGAGADTFYFARKGGADVITDFGAGGDHDAIDASALFSAGSHATLKRAGDDVSITFSTGESILVENVRLGELQAVATGWII